MSHCYETSDFDSKDDIPLANCSYKIVSGFDKGKAKTPEGRKNGIKEMYHFCPTRSCPKEWLCAAVESHACVLAAGNSW